MPIFHIFFFFTACTSTLLWFVVCSTTNLCEATGTCIGEPFIKTLLHSATCGQIQGTDKAKGMVLRALLKQTIAHGLPPLLPIKLHINWVQSKVQWAKELH